MATNRKRIYIKIVCSEGRTQSLRRITSAEQGERIFEGYKGQCMAVGNSGITQKWLDGLTYAIEDSKGNVIND